MRLNPKIAFLLATIAAGIIMSCPNLNYIDLLSQGDHGRDLYASVAVTQGQEPYKDFWWVYGPIMPYYYALFNVIFGTHITSIFLGKLIIKLALGSFFYLATATLMPLYLAFIAAVWFMQTQQEFFFTFNHIGGVAAGLAVTYCLFSYIRRAELRFLWIAGIFTFLFLLIKVNFGLACMVGLVLSVVIIDKIQRVPLSNLKKKFYLGTLVVLPLIAGILYWLLLNGLTIVEIRQCMPYLDDDQPHHVPIPLAITYYLQQHWLTLTHQIASALGSLNNLSSPFGLLIVVVSWLYLLQSIIMHACTLITAGLLLTGKIQKQERQHLLLALMVVAIFFVLYFHEFLVSGVWYRSYWSLPYLVLFHFITIATALKFAPKLLRGIIVGLMGLLIAFGAFVHFQTINAQKQPDRFLSMDKGQIFVGNEPQWTATVNDVTKFLTNTLRDDETFFAMPYDCLYYYLTGKKSPTRQLIFFNHIKIPPQQEIAIIQDLERNHVNYVVMSNRIASSELGMGIFGQSYCPLISQYINANFAPLTRQGGDWQAEPGWANNHGVIIFKRK